MSDKDLVHRTQQGDTHAFDHLVNRYHLNIYLLIQRHVPDPENVKDLCQETYLKAYLGINNFRGDSAFYSWLYRIAQNVCIDYHRKQQKHTDTEPLHAINEHRIARTHPSPCAGLQQQELGHILLEAIDQLPSMRKQVFRLRYIDDLSIKAIADQLNKSDGTIKTHLRKARQQLQALLQPYLDNKDIRWFSILS